MNDFMKVMTAGVTPGHKKILKQMEHSKFTNLAKQDTKRIRKGSRSRRR